MGGAVGGRGGRRGEDGDDDEDEDDATMARATPPPLACTTAQTRSAKASTPTIGA